ncbi:hypothetical protein LINGRAHAP2_LOCUS24554, partial [Linum grandiflorum]
LKSLATRETSPKVISSTPASSHLSSISKSRKAYASIIVKFSTLLQLSSTMATSKEDSQALQLVVTSSEAESQLSALVYDLSQQVQSAMGDMLKMTSEIDQNIDEVMVEMEKSKDFAAERKKALDEEKEKFQKAAYAVLEMLGS